MWAEPAEEEEEEEEEDEKKEPKRRVTFNAQVAACTAPGQFSIGKDTVVENLLFKNHKSPDCGSQNHQV